MLRKQKPNESRLTRRPSQHAGLGPFCFSKAEGRVWLSFNVRQNTTTRIGIWLLLGIIVFVGTSFGKSEDPFGPIDLAKWKEVPCVTGRLATDSDVDQGRAVFHIDAASGTVKPIDVGLPHC